jgi:hypothetical protein
MPGLSIPLANGLSAAAAAVVGAGAAWHVSLSLFEDHWQRGSPSAWAKDHTG